MRDVARRELLAALAACLFAGCGNDRPTPTVVCEDEPLTGGTPTPDYLALDARESAAVVAVATSDGHTGAPAVCSGIIVGAREVLTASHCVAADATTMQVVLSGSSRGEPGVLSVTSAVSHPSLDLALLELEDDVASVGDVAPPEIAEEGDLNEGALVQVAGYGATERGTLGTRLFATLSVVELEDTDFVTDAGGRAAACVGDSGGPALVRNDAGVVVVVGTLSSGSSDCAGEDTYVSLSAARSWLTSMLPMTTASDAPLADCSLLGSSGRCFGEAALWCDDDLVRASTCDTGRTCGFSTEAHGYRCIDASADPCDGVADRGRCDGDERVSCEDGRLVSVACDACGAHCALSVHSGEASCIAE